MRTISGIIGALLLAGCATTPKITTSATDEQITFCTTEASETKTSALTKTMVWASNLIVVPLTLPFGAVFVYPRSDEERWSEYYQACVERVTAGR